MLIQKSKWINSSTPNLLFIHGFLCSSNLWNDFSKLFESSYNIYYVNLPGHNGNNGSISSIKELAQSILTELTQLDLNNIHIIGHSLGGYIAGEMATIEHNRIKTITLINSSLLADSNQKKIDRDKAIRAVKITPTIFSKNVIKNLFSEKSRFNFPNTINQAQQVAASIKSQTIMDYLKAMRDRKNTLKLTHNIPKLFISSRKDTTIPFSRIQPQLATPNTTFIILEDSNHMGFIEESELVYKTINSFFVSFKS